MSRVQTILSCLCIAIAFANFVRAKNAARNPSNAVKIDISQGVVLYVADNEASVTFKMSSLLKGNEVAQRSTGRLRFKNDMMKRFGMAMMMAPLVIQLLSLPGAIASIKMTLLRSIFIGKIALAVMLYNSLKNSHRSEVVLIHKPEYHEHYYHTYHQPEDDDEGWWG